MLVVKFELWSKVERGYHIFVLSSGIENFQSISIKRNTIFAVFLLYLAKFEFFKDLAKLIVSSYLQILQKRGPYRDHNHCALLAFHSLRRRIAESHWKLKVQSTITSKKRLKYKTQLTYIFSKLLGLSGTVTSNRC